MRTAIMQKCQCDDYPIQGSGERHPARVLCSGKTSAFQADDTGSIPVTRFLQFQHLRFVLGEHQHKAAACELQV